MSVCYVGIDVHKQSFQTAIVNEEDLSRKISGSEIAVKE
jgi:hypothetical protein